MSNRDSAKSGIAQYRVVLTSTSTTVQVVLLEYCAAPRGDERGRAYDAFEYTPVPRGSLLSLALLISVLITTMNHTNTGIPLSIFIV